MRQTPISHKRAAIAIAAAVGALSATGPAQAQEGGPGEVTFSRDVAPILQANCQE